MALGPTGLEVFGSRISIAKAQIERGGQMGYWYPSIECTTINYHVDDELQTFDTAWFDYIELNGETSLIGRTTQWGIDGTTAIIPVVVTDPSGTITYIENTDYTLNLSLGTITRLPAISGGDIPVDGTISVTYDWRQNCIETRTGQPRKDCPNCHGHGVYYGTPTEVIGIMTIPQYNNPYERAGVWRLGDMTYSVPIEYTIKSQETSTTGFHAMDKFVIPDRQGNSVVWYVVSDPTTIQIGNEYLCTQCHIRIWNKDDSVNV